MHLEYIEKHNKPIQDAELVVIWMHGLGADCNDFVSLVPELNLDRSVKFIFPNAPMIPITVNNGYVMRGWYDIRDFSRVGAAVDGEGIYRSVEAINHIIEEQIANGFKSEQIILAGFSQGGVMSYTTGIMSKHKLGGIIALSAYLPDVETLAKNQANLNTPIFAAHGMQDPVVPYAAGNNAYTGLKAAGFNINWHQYPMQHSLCAQEIQDLSAWFKTILC